MNLISILWIAAGMCSLILATDGLLTRFMPAWESRTGPRPHLILFSSVMLVLGLGCVILGIYEATA